MKISWRIALIAAMASTSLLTSNVSATSISWNFNNGGLVSGSGFGNTRTYVADTHSVTLSAWGNTGTAGTLESGYLGSYGAYGLGACDRSEGAGCANPLHQVDNKGGRDWVLFLFDDIYEFDTVTIDPYRKWDRDVSFWIGNVDNTLDLTGATYSDLGGLGFGTQYDEFNSPSYKATDVSLLGLTGNALLFGAYKDETDFSSNLTIDRFKIKALTANTPIKVYEPTVLLLLGAGLLGLGLIRRTRPK